MNADISGPTDRTGDRFFCLAPAPGDAPALEIVTLWQVPGPACGFRLYARVACTSRRPMRAALHFWNTRHFNYPDGVSVTSPLFLIAAGHVRDVLVGRFPRSLGSDPMALRAQTRLIDCAAAT